VLPQFNNPPVVDFNSRASGYSFSSLSTTERLYDAVVRDSDLWSGRAVCRARANAWPENVCGENPHKYGTEEDPMSSCRRRGSRIFSRALVLGQREPQFDPILVRRLRERHSASARSGERPLPGENLTFAPAPGRAVRRPKPALSRGGALWASSGNVIVGVAFGAHQTTARRHLSVLTLPKAISILVCSVAHAAFAGDAASRDRRPSSRERGTVPEPGKQSCPNWGRWGRT